MYIKAVENEIHIKQIYKDMNYKNVTHILIITITHGFKQDKCKDITYYTSKMNKKRISMPVLTVLTNGIRI